MHVANVGVAVSIQRAQNTNLTKIKPIKHTVNNKTTNYPTTVRSHCIHLLHSPCLYP